MFHVFRLILIFLILVAPNARSAYRIVHDFSVDWWTMSGTAPYTGSPGENFTLHLSGKKEEGAVFLLIPKVPLNLFINGQWMGEFPGEDTLSLEELTVEGDIHTISVRQSFRAYPPALLKVTTFQPAVSPQQIIEIKVRAAKSWVPEFNIIVLLIILVFFLILRFQFPKAFLEYFSLDRALSLKVRDDVSRARILNSITLVFMAFTSLMGAFWLQYILEKQEISLFSSELIASLPYQLLMLLLMFVLIMFFFLIKYFLITTFSQLFNLKGFGSLHFIDHLKVTLFVFFVFFIASQLILVAFRGQYEPSLSFLLNAFVVFAIIRFLYLQFKLITYSSHRKLYLFLYLCTTELVPLLIGLKLVGSH